MSNSFNYISLILKLEPIKEDLSLWYNSNYFVCRCVMVENETFSQHQPHILPVGSLSALVIYHLSFAQKYQKYRAALLQNQQTKKN